jgi:hypothetical protein
MKGNGIMQKTVISKVAQSCNKPKIEVAQMK